MPVNGKGWHYVADDLGKNGEQWLDWALAWFRFTNWRIVGNDPKA